MHPNIGLRPPFPARGTLSASYKKPSPPPPYGDNLTSPKANSLSESATAHRIHALAKDVFAGDVPSAIEEWINERSREELSSLLVRANELIRERERGKSTRTNLPSPYELTVPVCLAELNMTSELSRNLYNSNIALEEKHKALLARLPTAVSATTPLTTPSSSPAPTPEYRATPLPHTRNLRARRISVSPSDLALLADQNSELLQKLEKLEAETAQANLAGRRRLGKLEKEIDVLREELDQHRTRSDALQLQVARGDEETRRRRQEWSERVRAHRNHMSGSSWAFSSDGEGGVRDFAPSANNRPSLPSVVLKQPVLPAAPDTDSLTHHHDIHIGSDSPAEAPSTLPPSPQRSPSLSAVPPPAGESALFAQLVSKVRELEVTNSQILESQRDTATKLQEAQIEAEGIRRLYAFLDEQSDVQLEVVEDGAHDEDPPEQDPSSTMRFRSLRRSIHGDLRQLATPTLENGPESDKEGTVSSNGLIKGHAPKARRTVVGLFDTPSQPARDGAEPAMMVSNPSSPALSSLDLPPGSLFSVSRQASRGPTLGSELGSDYGDNYVENHHLRSSSLYDVFLSEPSAISRPTTPTSPPRHDTQDESQPSQDLDKTPQKSSFKATHRHRLSDTIRARTHYWVDRRFHHTAPTGLLTSLFEPERGNSSSDGSAPSSKKPVVAQVQAAVQTMPCEAGEEDLALVKVDKVHALQSTLEAPEPKRGRAMKVVLELWLWVQFVIIIMVFLWAVTKRGPRSVLRNASRTSAVKRIE